MGKNNHRVRDLFIAASEMSTAEERAAFLDEVCRGRPGLRQNIEDLLAAYDPEDDFLGGESSASDPGQDAHGTIIGRYKLLEEIGEGAFGRVFMAEQTEPVRRKVALKVVKAGMDTREVVARFEAERQALTTATNTGERPVRASSLALSSLRCFSLPPSLGWMPRFRS